jgi:hypothetical protein
MMEAVGTSETSVNFCQTIRRNNPENSHLHALRRENLKSQDLEADSISAYRQKESGPALFGPLVEAVIRCGSRSPACVGAKEYNFLTKLCSYMSEIIHFERNFLNS